MQSDSQHVSQRYCLLTVLGTLAFGVAHTQAPLYYSNQNQYFLHGMADAGIGNLQNDWLANTLDPTPVFSAVVAWTYRHLEPFAFYGYFFVLFAIYFLSLLAIGAALLPENVDKRQRLILLGIAIIVLHSGCLRLASVAWFGTDYSWYFQSGVAGQYVLGPGLQPSAFGILLITSIAAFLYQRFVLAVACVAVACTFHATYLLPAALLTVGYLVWFFSQSRYRAAVYFGTATLLTVLPVVIYSAKTFAPTTTELFETSQRILAEIRIPHHAQITRWLDRIAEVQLVGLGLALLLLRKTPLFLVLGVASILAALLTLLQWQTQNPSLALVFPWRISAVLIPIATTVLLTRCIRLLPSLSWFRIGAVLLVVLVLVYGVIIQVRGMAYHANQQEIAALRAIRAQKQPGDVYLIPVHVPQTNGGPRGSVSTSFTAPPGKETKHLISVDLQRFRLFTQAAIYVDFKAIPYKDTDVIEWYRRLQQSGEWYRRNDWSNPAIIAELQAEGITHLLLPTTTKPPPEGWDLVHADDYYQVFRLQKEGTQP